MAEAAWWEMKIDKRWRWYEMALVTAGNKISAIGFYLHERRMPFQGVIVGGPNDPTRPGDAIVNVLQYGSIRPHGGK